MSKRTLAILTLAAAVVFLLFSTGCVTKKRYRTLEQHSAEQIAQATPRSTTSSRRARPSTRI